MSGSIERVHVVVPARDEAAHLEAHLRALREAVSTAVGWWPGLQVMVTLVLDRCRDGSAEIARRHPWVDVVEADCGCVGSARAQGVDRVRHWHREVSAERVWVACTDADSRVAPGWLVGQLLLAGRGHELVLGVVRPEPGDLSPAALVAWWARHHLHEGHTHVHGANLGFTLDAYDRVGGFAPLRTGEDVDLVTRMRAAGVSTYATARQPVTTSGRHCGRAPDGFAAYVARLDRHDVTGLPGGRDLA